MLVDQGMLFIFEPLYRGYICVWLQVMGTRVSFQLRSDLVGPPSLVGFTTRLLDPANSSLMAVVMVTTTTSARRRNAGMPASQAVQKAQAQAQTQALLEVWNSRRAPETSITS